MLQLVFEGRIMSRIPYRRILAPRYPTIPRVAWSSWGKSSRHLKLQPVVHHRHTSVLKHHYLFDPLRLRGYRLLMISKLVKLPM